MHIIMEVQSTALETHTLPIPHSNPTILATTWMTLAEVQFMAMENSTLQIPPSNPIMLENVVGQYTAMMRIPSLTLHLRATIWFWQIHQGTITVVQSTPLADAILNHAHLTIMPHLPMVGHYTVRMKHTLQNPCLATTLPNRTIASPMEGQSDQWANYT